MFYYEYNQDLSQIEFLYIETKDGLSYKSSFLTPGLSKFEELAKLIKWVNGSIDPHKEWKVSR